MANSYTEVTLTQAQTTGFTTPSYVDVGHLVVKVNDVVVPNTSVGATNKVFGSFTSTNPLHYLIIAGQTSLSFNEALPSGAKVHIQRSSNQNSRLVDYSDASLLTADTMDRDANQIFFVAQEALDQSSLTNVAASDFYYSQGTEPATNTVGTLWYDTSSTPNVLKIRSSTGFELAAPIMTQVTIDGSALAAGTGTYSGYDVIPVGSDFNTKSALYLNGIKQVAGASLGDNDYFQVGTNVYIPTVADTDVIQVISNAQNLDDVVNKSAAQTITGAKVFSANTDFGAGVDVTGNITVTGTVDNVDVAALSSSVSNVDNTSDANKPVSTATQTALDLKANIASPTFTGNVGGITSAMVGLSNVDNTTDANKPVSTATQTALDLKAPIASPTFTGTVTADGLNTSDHIVVDNNKRIKLKDTSGNTATEIYTDGSNNTFIAEGNSSGSLTIKGESFYIRNADNQALVTSGGGSVELAHCPDANTSNKRLETTASGIDVTGTVTADGITSSEDINIAHTKDLIFRNAADDGDQLVIKTSGNTSYIQELGSDHLWITGDRLILAETASSNDYRIIVGDSNGVKLYADDSNGVAARRLKTTANNVTLSTGVKDSEVDIVTVSSTGIDVTGTVTADSITSAPTTVVTTNSTVPTVAVNKKYIDTYDSGVNAYVLPTGTVGQMITFVNASTQNITLNRNTNSITLEKVIAGSDPANVTDATITVGKSGAVEVAYTGTNTAVIFGSGIS